MRMSPLMTCRYSYGIVIAFTTVTAVLDAVELIMYSTHGLLPSMYLASNATKFALWFIYFVLSVKTAFDFRIFSTSIIVCVLLL